MSIGINQHASNVHQLIQLYMRWISTIYLSPHFECCPCPIQWHQLVTHAEFLHLQDFFNPVSFFRCLKSQRGSLHLIPSFKIWDSGRDIYQFIYLSINQYIVVSIYLPIYLFSNTLISIYLYSYLSQDVQEILCFSLSSATHPSPTYRNKKDSNFSAQIKCTVTTRLFLSTLYVISIHEYLLNVFLYIVVYL